MGRWFGKIGNRAIVAVAAIAVMTTTGTVAMAQQHEQRHRYVAPDVFPDDVQTETAGIRQVPKSKLYVIAADFNNDGKGCVSFVNQSLRTAKRIRFLFSGADANGNEVEDFVYAVSGTFGPNQYKKSQCGATGKLWSVATIATGSTHRQIPVADIVTPIEVDYTDGTSWSSGPDVMGSVIPGSNSDVTVTRAFAWDGVGECVDFIASGHRDVNHIQFMFSHLRADGTSAGADPLDVRKEYNPGDKEFAACRTFSGQISPELGSAPNAAPGGIVVNSQPTALAAYVRRIDYTDGTSWTIAGVPTPPFAASVSSAVRYDTWWPAVSQVPVAVAPRGDSTIELTDGYAWSNYGQTICVNYVPQSPVPATHIWFRSSYTSVQGQDAGYQTIDDWTRFAGSAQGTVHKSCWSPEPVELKDAVPPALLGLTPVSQPLDAVPAVLTIMYPVQWEDGSLPAQFTHGQSRVSICISVDRVDFTDGTSWQAQAPGQCDEKSPLR
jgi:hypothetical protein